MRLGRARDFQCLFRDGRRSADRCLTVLARPNARVLPRIGFALSRKHVSGAVRRNRIKRVIRDSFRLNQDMLTGLDIVVIARPGLARRSAAELRASLEAHWATLRRKCGNPAGS